MEQTQARFDLKLPTPLRHGLDGLSHETGLSRADLIRLSVRYLLANREAILRPGEIQGGER
jgi:hypothetical protein